MTHTMVTEALDRFCGSKLHTAVIDSGIKRVRIVPEYRRDMLVSGTEKRGKLFNYKRPTADILSAECRLYVFPGADYVGHYSKIYRQLGYTVESTDVDDSMSRDAVAQLFPAMPKADVAIIGYVDGLIGNSGWKGNKDISWRLEQIGGTSVLFVGVAFSYWGNLIYFVVEQLSQLASLIIYSGKLGSLSMSDTPNRTIASGDSSSVLGETVEWDNVFANDVLVSYGDHITLPSVLDETDSWFTKSRGEYRFVDPEIGWAAKACQDNGAQFSYLHLVTDNLCGDFIDDLTNERKPETVSKRLQYLGIIKSILWHTLAADSTSLYAAVLEAQQKRVDRGILKPLRRDWEACLSFARHTEEEAFEVIRELPRREWKEQTVDPGRVLAELADAQIQLYTTLAYAGFTDIDLRNALLAKLGTKRTDWK